MSNREGEFCKQRDRKLWSSSQKAAGKKGNKRQNICNCIILRSYLSTSISGDNESLCSVPNTYWNNLMWSFPIQFTVYNIHTTQLWTFKCQKRVCTNANFWPARDAYVLTSQIMNIYLHLLTFKCQIRVMLRFIGIISTSS